MGQAVIGGVLASSLLTLVVVPVVYAFLDDVSAWLKSRMHPTNLQQIPPKSGGSS
jgi:HAE1 family hydrophobic/amphiphilic exporter-1